MDVAASQPPSHHGTAAPTRSSPPKPTTPRQVVGTTRASRSNNNNSSNGGKTPLATTATTRKKGAATIVAVAAAAAAASAAAAAAALGVGGGNGGGGGGGVSAVPGGGGGAVKKRDSAKKGGAESPRGARGGASGVNGGSGSGSGNASGVSRKRVRVRDEKLGEFAVLLAPYEGDHNDICEICDKGGDLLCCDFCNLVYHLCCVTPKLTELPDEDLWMCPACTAEVTSRQIAKRRRLEDGGRSTSPGPGGSGRHHGQERVRGYQGVKAENDAFRAFVLYKNQTMDIGLFPTAQAAARAYDRKALSLFGDAAVCNFPADEQVEVEGVATDGTTVKGVVRSFHQWRAEMQWGNKKRHLGFFERLEHASQAYNRAALYMNGPETPLNPTKEGYVPPPLTERSVRVPRNKLFVQQLPLPLIAQAQVEGANNSAEFIRRRQQMRGKYHSPLVGDNHQVSRLPPLPPPSTPRASRIRSVACAAAAAAAAPSSAGEAAMSPLGATVAAAPGGLTSESRVKGSGTACVDLPEALRVQVSSKLVISQAVAAPAAAAAALPAVVGTVTYSPVASAVASQAVAGKGKGRATAAANDTVGCPPASKPPPPTAVVASCAESLPEAAAGAETAFTTNSATVLAASSSAGVAKPPAAAEDGVSKPPAACVAATALTSPPRGLTKAVNSTGDGTVLANRGEMMMLDWERPSRSQLADSMEVDNRPGLDEAAANTAVSAATPPPADVSRMKAEDGSVVITAGTTTTTVSEASLKALYPAAAAAAAAVAAEASRSQIPAGGCETFTWGQTKPTEAEASVAPPSTPRRASAESEGGGGSRSADYRPVTGWERTTLMRAPSPPAPSPPQSSLPVKGTPVLASSGVTRGQAGVGAAETASLAMKPLRSAVASATPASSSVTPPARSPSPNAAGRKRRLGAGGGGGGCSASGSGNGVTGPGTSSSSSSSSGSGSNWGREGGTGALPPPPPPPPPIPDLSFEDVAELVWDPRSGPKPRGAAEARGPRGVAAANRSPLEQAMWDRDSTLLERVAPAHAEKSMQVLQMHRHDVERAAQMLTVRHGIHVMGLSSVRTTRNKRAEQQQQQQQSLLNPAARPPSSSFAATGGSSGSSGGGGGGGGRSSGRASFEGWQAAAAPRAPPAAKAVGTASPTHGGASGPGGGGGGAVAAAGGAPRCGKKADAQGVTREEAKLAGDAFMRHGRDLNAVQKTLGWKRSRVVEYYYCVWKYSPAYQVWKATRHKAGLPGVSKGAGTGGAGSGVHSASAGGLTGGGILNASSDGMRWRGSRLRTLKAPSSQ